MIQGTMSGAGKSLLCTALCRIFRQDGLRVAPFKSQNMALNSGVTRDGREIGRAQIAQAEAAGVEPDARMNPILLKPTSDMGSQVIVNGVARGTMTAAAYFACKKRLVPDVLAAYRSLAADYDVVVIEGAGSPAEINLRENDIVNMGLAELLDAPVLLAGDIDRGGVFAQLYGTVALLTEAERARVKGLVVNKFRGDAALLAPGLRQLEQMTGVPVLGVVPYLNVEIDDEDSLAPRLAAKQTDKPVDIAVIRLPHLSNFTDFAPLDAHPLLGVRYVLHADELGEPDMVVLPGTKSTMADLLWLRQNGLEAAIARLAARGTPTLGVCGGYQMLGEELRDPDGVEGGQPVLRGMGLLPCVTTFAPRKTLSRARARVGGIEIEGYQIHMGETEARGEAFCRLENGEADGCVRGNVCGTYLHGLFDSGALVDALAARLCERKGMDAERAPTEDRRAYRERQYDLLARGVREALDMDAVYRVLEGRA
ncbi:MAG: cobyric acid synthase [Oscillospiraceae bacterium]|nr:cobyric acid synthase [Oscillospiraceae bacterium]